MENNTEQHLNRLCKLARELGATKAKAFDAKDVVVDERVRLKCQIPICDDYGINLMCPPHLGISISNFARTLSKYRIALLLQVNCLIPHEMQQLIKNETDYVTNLYQNNAFIASYHESFTLAKMKLHEIVHRVESAAFSMGYRFAVGFIGGSCRLCAECIAISSNEPCRHPFRARPSMEAMGIDVFQTAANAGLPFDIPPKETAVWNGLVLVD
ncbi:MAG: DUF2284 domain-containing protein [Candidatus Heimdallarchaeota archaeon]